MAELFTYKPVIPPSENTSDYEPPKLEQAITLYNKTGYPETPQGLHTIASALRGSAASYLSRDGTFHFRNKHSDIDYYAITTFANIIGAGYRIYKVSPPGYEKRKEVDVLYFTPDALEREQAHSHKTFLTSKLVQPGWAVVYPEMLEHFRVGAMAALVIRGCARRSIRRLTESGAAQLVVEEDLYAEPWRWTSLRGAYTTSPYPDRQKAQLLHHCHLALKMLQENGRVTDKTAEYSNPEEDVYEVDQLSIIGKRNPQADQLKYIYNFVLDQLSILAHSRQGLHIENAVRVLMKLGSWRLSYDADSVFIR